ncbi:TonB-dependent receptor [Terrimonas sp. NA20]|uniref:TonB-dependent receptor n=1 Tax=Terrimonas ginsenosidimutans TaxID=2908004 RepID=A0ABS9KSR1_9BACT|nr:TonB-dependent receptor [Terrimonas ginsenosidimutans]MCG2615359.1 TonB-dependent receptor [Terrimonas ginsenosidimutans]
MEKVKVTGFKKKNPFDDRLPAQSLSQQTLQQVNAPTVGDAARFFSGVQVKDYGGAGGLKTISVRSLGASHSGLLYDGIPVSDVQSGQTDLSRFSSNNLQSLDLYQPNPSVSLLPARAFSSGSVLAMYTPSFNVAALTRNRWQAGVRNGSFGYWQAFGGAAWILPRNTILSFYTEGVSSEGDYPFTVINGNLSEKTKRNNSRLRSLQGEINLSKQFRDSSSLQLKAWSFVSKRGLPGAIVFFNDRSVQQLYNRDYFVQTRYVKSISENTSLLIAGKFNHAYTRYRDPDFLNNSGGLDDRYRQNEGYLSASVSQAVSQNITAALSADFAYTTLHANKSNFAKPSRWSNWDNLLLSYADSLWQVQGSVLWSYFQDETKRNNASVSRNKFTPAFSLSRKLGLRSPLMLRAFYKEVYRMPTFNDLYYNFIGNTSLRPELARQYNFGVTYSAHAKGTAGHFSASVDGYINRINDKIVAVPSQNLFVWTMLNLGKVDIKGVDVTAEAGGAFGMITWNARVSYTWQQARDITDPSSSSYRDRIPYTPDHSGSGILSVAYRKWTAGYSAVLSGTRYTIGDNSSFTQMDGWGTQDVFVARNFSLKQLHLQVKAELNNLADRRYDIINLYPMPGRSYKIGFTINQ